MSIQHFPIWTKINRWHGLPGHGILHICGFSVLSNWDKWVKRPDLRSMALTQVITRSDKDMTKLRFLLRQIYRKWLENDQMIPEYSWYRSTCCHKNHAVTVTIYWNVVGVGSKITWWHLAEIIGDHTLAISCHRSIIYPPVNQHIHGKLPSFNRRLHLQSDVFPLSC